MWKGVLCILSSNIIPASKRNSPEAALIIVHLFSASSLFETKIFSLSFSSISTSGSISFILVLTYSILSASIVRIELAKLTFTNFTPFNFERLSSIFEAHEAQSRFFNLYFSIVEEINITISKNLIRNKRLPDHKGPAVYPPLNHPFPIRVLILTVFSTSVT